MADNKVLKKTLRHYIDLEFYANSVDEEMQALLRKLIKECDEIIDSQPSYNTKAEYNIAYKLIKEKIKEFGLMLYERLEEEAELTMKEEEEFLKSLYSKEEAEILLQKENNGDESEESDEEDEESKESEDNEDDEADSTNLALTFAGISLARILFVPIDGRDTVKQFAERTQKNILGAYDNSLRAGYLFGQKSEDIKNQINGKMKQISNGMQAGIQTAIPSFAKNTDRIFFKQNNIEVVWCAVLDGKGCLVCYSYNGLHFPSVALAPETPQHARCRCILQPANLIKEPLPTYEEYIESLSDEEQYHILGKNRYEMWKNYGIRLNKFVNNGIKLKLDEIRLNALTSEKSEKLLKQQEKVNPELFKRVVKGLTKNGYVVEQGPEIDRYLNKFGLEAVTFPTADGKATIFYHSKLSASGMYEEIIHTAQYRRLGYEKSKTLYNELEVEAKQKLLKNAKSYGITEGEIKSIKELLEHHKQEILNKNKEV